MKKASLILLWIFSNVCFAIGGIYSIPTLSELLEADLIFLINSEDLNYLNSSEGVFIEVERAQNLSEKKVQKIKFPYQFGKIPESSFYLLFLNKGKKDEMVLQNDFISFLPIYLKDDDLWGSDLNHQKIKKLLMESMFLLSDDESRNLISLMLTSLPQADLKVLLEEPLGDHKQEQTDVALFNVMLAAYSTDAIEYIQNTKNFQILKEPLKNKRGELEAPFYQYQVERAIVGEISRKTTKENAHQMLLFAFQQPTFFSGDILSQIANKCGKESLTVTLERMISSTSLSEKYGCLQIVATIFERSDLVPIFEEFKKNPSLYMERLFEIIKDDEK